MTSEKMDPYLAGGHIVIATWCQREESPDKPLTPKDKAALQFLYDEWAHPYFVSVQEYGRLLEVILILLGRHTCHNCLLHCLACADRFYGTRRFMDALLSVATK